MYGRSRGVAFLFVVILAAIIGYGAYNLGVSHGLALSPPVAVTATPGTTAAPPVVYPYGWYPYGYGWHRPWGFGFFFPFLFFAFFFIAVRGLLWRGRWGHGWRGGGYEGVPPAFDHWHRRAHERMNTDPSAGGSTQHL